MDTPSHTGLHPSPIVALGFMRVLVSGIFSGVSHGWYKFKNSWGEIIFHTCSMKLDSDCIETFTCKSAENMSPLTLVLI
jgi:hypothetical protein